MAQLIQLNKPFNVLCQFTDGDNRATLANYISKPGVYAAGRLDYDSEGLVLLTDDGRLQQQISNPKHKMVKIYYAQVEGELTPDALQQLRLGVDLKDGLTRPAKAEAVPEPDWLWERSPPIRSRPSIPTSWLELQISEGRNRQVRRMTAAVGFPTLRLIRYAIGRWSIDNLTPGEYRSEILHMAQPKPVAAPNTRNRKLKKSR